MNDSPSKPADNTTPLQKSVFYYQAGDRTNARHFALESIRANPNNEASWLILAAVSSPSASLAYLQKARQILPNSDRLRKAQLWAETRLEKTDRESQFSPPLPNQEPTPKTPSAALPAQSKRKIPGYAVLFLFFFMFVVLFFTFNRLTVPVHALAFFAAEQVVSRPEGVYEKPTRTPTPTNTLTPTLTPTPTLTFTPTPTQTATPTQTNTPEPTWTPRPESDVPEIEPGEYWIDIDLSDQMLYAYQGQEVVNQFLISSGTLYTPTVTGQFHIYVKYEAADMSGPGYYLPSVPYVMYFYIGYGIHAATWHNNFGTPMSHGCINMRLEDAEWMFHWASINTLVNIHN